MEDWVINPENDRVQVRNIYGVGRNYADHAKEMGNQVLSKPMYFQKSLAALTTKDILHLPPDREIHYELEMVILIKKDGFKITQRNAPDYIDGFALGLDLTDRPLQHQLKNSGHPWFMAKSFKGAAYVGKFFHFKDKLWMDNFWLRRDGKELQSGHLSQMLFSFAELIETLSLSIPLLKGDLIFTGTPKGVGQLFSNDTLELGVGSQTIQILQVLVD